MTQILTNSDTFTGQTYVNSKTVGAMVLISSQTISNQATVDFTSLTGAYSAYYMVINECGPVTATATLQFQASQDNGSTWLTTGYQNGIDAYAYNSITGVNTNSTTFIPLSSAMTSNTYVGSFYIYNTNIGAGVCLGGQGIWSNAGAPSTGFYLGQGPTGVNALRLKYSTGNISNARISLYGVLS